MRMVLQLMPYLLGCQVVTLYYGSFLLGGTYLSSSWLAITVSSYSHRFNLLKESSSAAWHFAWLHIGNSRVQPASKIMSFLKQA